MPDEKNSSRPDKAGLVNKDISPVLKGWDYESGTLSVRKIPGLDGAPKLQLRLDLGILQMEMTGRPDGHRPNGHESLLDFFETLLKEHQERNGTELGFHLTGEQCERLREEAMMYYHRYLGLFALGEFDGVVRDTDRNLRVLDLCGKYAVEDQDRLFLEQYRPYLIMMNTRAAASLDFQQNRYSQALETVQNGLAEIKEFFVRFGQEAAYPKCSEVRVLKRLARDIRQHLPADPLRKLKSRLDKAVKHEAYEEAAVLRDKIKLIQQSRDGGLNTEIV